MLGPLLREQYRVRRASLGKLTQLKYREQINEISVFMLHLLKLMTLVYKGAVM